MSTFVNILSNF